MQMHPYTSTARSGGKGFGLNTFNIQSKSSERNSTLYKANLLDQNNNLDNIVEGFHDFYEDIAVMPINTQVQQLKQKLESEAQKL